MADSQNESEFVALVGRIVEAVSAEQRHAVLRGVEGLLYQTECDVLEAMWALPDGGKS